MARLLSILAVGLFSIMAHASACPTLGGVYQCSADGKSLDIAIRDLGPGHYLLEDSIPVRADSLGITEVAEGMGFRITTTSTCLGGDLQVVLEQFNAETSQLLAKVVKNYQRKDLQHLLIRLTTESFDKGRDHLEVQCVRN